jgi:DNA adenine methylase
MPCYQGGKARIGAQIYEVIEKFEKKFQWRKKDFFEPFCGMLGVGIHAAKKERIVVACDMNEDLMLMWQALQKGWMPSENTISQSDYNRYKKSKKPSAMRGFVGICCSYGSIFFAGYRICVGNDLNSVSLFKRTLKTKMLPYLSSVKFVDADSYDTFAPENMTVYADPPYFDNNYTGRNDFFKFDHKHFWNVMRQWSKKNLVFISEYSAPHDFVSVWEKPVSINSKKRTEKLFMHKSYFNKAYSVEFLNIICVI